MKRSSLTVLRASIAANSLFAEVSAQPSRAASFARERLSRARRVKMSGGDWISPSS
jgi:hypothetical protein